MLLEHLDRLRTDDAPVLDRGYPSRWLVTHLTQQGIALCMRVHDSAFVTVREFPRSGQEEALVIIAAPNQTDCADDRCTRAPTSVRLVRVVTPNGRIRAVMTSLLGPVGGFADLYHRRWRIEEAFKHRLALENTSGGSWLAAQQDVGAKVLVDNRHALAATAATRENTVAAPHKANLAYASAHLKRCPSRWLLCPKPGHHSTSLLNLVQFKPGAFKPRPMQPKPHRKHACKSTT